MIFIHDSRIPKEAIDTLQNYGQCLPFITKNYTNDELAGHPDLFYCSINNNVISDPRVFRDNNFIPGYSKTGRNSEATHYNAVVTDSFIIHNNKYTDISIIDLCRARRFINVHQSFTRCSLLPLPDNSFITSDKGIAKALSNNNLEYLLVDFEDIILPGYKNGCIGGCFGIINDTVFSIGSMSFHKNGKAMIQFLKKHKCQLVELYHGPLFDGGSIIIYTP